MPFAVQACCLLSEWITFLLAAVAPRSRRTFIELLCGCLMSQDGWLTRAIAVVGRGCHWTTYFKLIARGSIQTLALAHQLLRLLIRFVPPGLTMLVLDDTLVMRWSAAAPGAAIRREHSRKPNRPRFVNAQCWITLGIVMACGVLPIRSRLVPGTGNTNKLAIAGALVRTVASIVPGARVLVDSWYMRRRVVVPLLTRGMRIIGQVRRDTALFMPPAPADPSAPRRRGRPRLYGPRLTAPQIDVLPASEHRLWIYGKQQQVRIVTSGLFAGWMRRHFSGVAFRHCLRPKVQDIHLPRAPRRPACTTRPSLNRPRGGTFGRPASFAAFCPSLQSPGKVRECLNPSLDMKLGPNLSVTRVEVTDPG